MFPLSAPDSGHQGGWWILVACSCEGTRDSSTAWLVTSASSPFLLQEPCCASRDLHGACHSPLHSAPRCLGQRLWSKPQTSFLSCHGLTPSNLLDILQASWKPEKKNPYFCFINVSGEISPLAQRHGLASSAQKATVTNCSCSVQIILLQQSGHLSFLPIKNLQRRYSELHYTLYSYSPSSCTFFSVIFM